MKTHVPVPEPYDLRTFKIPGYLMPLLAEWLQLSLASTYAFLTAGKIPGAATITRLSQAPYNVHPSLWKKPPAFRAEVVYEIWYKWEQDKQEEGQQSQALNDILQ